MRATIFAILSFLLLSMGADAQKTYRVQDVPNTKLRDADSYVSNPDMILSPGTVARINTILKDLQQKTGVEVAVVALTSIGNDTPEDFSERLFQQWGIGKKGNDNGLLILLATADRYIRFEVGYGLEGVLTDALSKRIQTQRMNQYLKEGDWDRGMLEGVMAVDELLTDPDSELAFAEPETSGFIRNIIFILICLGAISAIAVIASKRRMRCPKCNTKMVLIDQNTIRLSPSVRVVNSTWRCPKCGYTTTKKRTENIGSAMAGGAIGGTLAGGGFGGGGTRGGSWGGGRSGGGGATSRF